MYIDVKYPGLPYVTGLVIAGQTVVVEVTPVETESVDVEPAQYVAVSFESAWNSDKVDDAQWIRAPSDS